ncbi:flagellar biosynthetic protein FliR [Methylocystis sp. MJC1]|uniref:flagellar biosynthetic protein FliR n=1 Tax=Methylocystis sp. MJC1 TaxID=2654282 RepID=UPI0013EC7D35|nr:flagellar biosynthetic protein FliR [Methylocystis sp. MJC1]MBU6525704.1 flagellar biosynthetic protein FliR [Methylocystis sp. MJC1]UZX12176.1 flagellar biosynthetic protein FliR [Methylocystis sp. MJC1]
MSAPLDLILEAWFVVFCRVAGCIMLLPGLGSERAPVRVRLYIAIAVSAPLAVYLWPRLAEPISAAPLVTAAVASVSETIIGVLIGLTCRMFLFAVETMFTGVTLSIGLGNALGAPINESEPTPALTALVTTGLTTLIFAMDLHLELLRGIGTSYDHVAPFALQSSESMLREVLKALEEAYLVVFRITSPFLIFGLLSNVAVAFLNKMTPLVPVYFAATPALIFGGLAFLYAFSSDALGELAMEYAAWLARG